MKPSDTTTARARNKAANREALAKRGGKEIQVRLERGHLKALEKAKAAFGVATNTDAILELLERATIASPAYVAMTHEDVKNLDRLRKVKEFSSYAGALSWALDRVVAIEEFRADLDNGKVKRPTRQIKAAAVS